MEGCREWRRQAARQGSWGAGQPHKQLREAGTALRQDGRPWHGRLAPLFRLIGQTPFPEYLQGAQLAA